MRGAAEVIGMTSKPASARAAHEQANGAAAILLRDAARKGARPCEASIGPYSGRAPERDALVPDAEPVCGGGRAGGDATPPLALEPEGPRPDFAAPRAAL